MREDIRERRDEIEQIRRENKLLMDIKKASILGTKDVTATIS